MKNITKKPILLLFAFALASMTFYACTDKAANDPEQGAPVQQTKNGDMPKTPIDKVDIKGSDAKPESPKATTQVQWENDAHNFGEVPEGDTAQFKFVFTNTGTEELLIESAKPSCACTVTGYTKEAVPPGAKGYVIAAYPAKNTGVFKKSVTVISNTDPKAKILNISGEVVK